MKSGNRDKLSSRPNLDLSLLNLIPAAILVIVLHVLILLITTHFRTAEFWIGARICIIAKVLSLDLLTEDGLGLFLFFNAL